MDRLPSDYRGTDEPHCDADAGATVIDFALSAALIGTAIYVGMSDRTDSGQGAAVFGGLAAVDLISAGVAIGWASECRNAKRQWFGEGGSNLTPEETDFMRKVEGSKRRMRCSKHPEECQPKAAELVATPAIDAGVPVAADAALDGGE